MPPSRCARANPGTGRQRSSKVKVLIAIAAWGAFCGGTVSVAAEPEKLAPKCEADAVLWEGRCFYHDEFDIDEKRCPDGVFLLRPSENLPRCISCREVMNIGVQQPMNWCAGLEARRSTAAMEAEYQKMLQDFPSRGVELRSSQADWVAKRDAACEAVLKGYAGGSMGPMDYAFCKSGRGLDRTKELRALRLRWTKK
jgi:uncharacterized protein YecT (DUF1311 family)